MSNKHVVSFSGGMGSFAEAKLCCDTFGKENVILLFCDTLAEDQDLARPELKSTLGIERFLEAGFRLAWEYCKNKGENNEP